MKRYLSLVKFAHTVFALPFALLGYVYASVHAGVGFDWWLLGKILLCMVLARNAAMGFNRWADRKFDAENPRTAGREIPAGRVSPRVALIFVAVNAVCFVLAAAWINRLTFALSPVALGVVLGYSYTKRFTAWSHVVLGVALGIAPVGAYVAVAGGLAVMPVVLAGVVASWVAGFDILYSMQDARHDREHGLHSVPARFSTTGARVISIVLHLVCLYGVRVAGLWMGGGRLYWVGAAVFFVLLAAQHLLSGPRYARLFTLMNGGSSILLAGFAIADILL